MKNVYQIDQNGQNAPKSTKLTKIDQNNENPVSQNVPNGYS